MIGALGLSPTDAVIVIAAIGYAVKVIADQRGWTRSTALVRQENADLRERNATLAAEVERLDKADREKGEQLASMQRELDLLRERDQAAVLDAVARLGETLAARDARHEQAAERRRGEQKAEHVDAMNVWQGIRDDLRTLTNQPKGAAS